MFLPERPNIDRSAARRIERDYERFKSGLPKPLEEYVLQHYQVDLSSEYAGKRIKNPFGKASGQLSLALHQIEKDAECGLGFAVLKTVIAQNEQGSRSMQEWAIPETRMLVERIRGSDGRLGWTVTWKGRGWHESFEKYLRFFGEAIGAGRAAGMLVVPSCKYHLPMPGEKHWRVDEYRFTTQSLLQVWRQHEDGRPAMPLEKDFSPTLAGSSRASQKETILEWLRTVPGLIRSGVEAGSVTIGLKIFNAMFEEQFQLEMLDLVHRPEADVDFLVYANRLFDPHKEFDGKVGVAYGGPDLSGRNLRALKSWRARKPAGAVYRPISGSGDICSGRMAVEYLQRGCSSFQMHTLFQLPNTEFAMPRGHKIERALHQLYFHPEEGFLVWLCHLRQALGWPVTMNIKQMARYFASAQFAASEPGA